METNRHNNKSVSSSFALSFDRPLSKLLQIIVLFAHIIS